MSSGMCLIWGKPGCEPTRDMLGLLRHTLWGLGALISGIAPRPPAPSAALFAWTARREQGTPLAFRLGGPPG